MNFVLYILVEDSLKNKKYIPFDKWEKILKSPTNLVELTEDDGSYLGKTLNKSFVISSEPDFYYSIKEYSKKLINNQNNLTKIEIDKYQNHFKILNGNNNYEKGKLISELIKVYSKKDIDVTKLLENNNNEYNYE